MATLPELCPLKPHFRPGRGAEDELEERYRCLDRIFKLDNPLPPVYISSRIEELAKPRVVQLPPALDFRNAAPPPEALLKKKRGAPYIPMSFKERQASGALSSIHRGDSLLDELDRIMSKNVSGMYKKASTEESAPARDNAKPPAEKKVSGTRQPIAPAPAGSATEVNVTPEPAALASATEVVVPSQQVSTTNIVQAAEELVAEEPWEKNEVAAAESQASDTNEKPAVESRSRSRSQSSRSRSRSQSSRSDSRSRSQSSNSRSRSRGSAGAIEYGDKPDSRPESQSKSRGAESYSVDDFAEQSATVEETKGAEQSATTEQSGEVERQGSEDTYDDESFDQLDRTESDLNSKPSTSQVPADSREPTSLSRHTSKETSESANQQKSGDPSSSSGSRPATAESLDIAAGKPATAESLEMAADAEYVPDPDFEASQSAPKPVSADAVRSTSESDPTGTSKGSTIVAETATADAPNVPEEVSNEPPTQKDAIDTTEASPMVAETAVAEDAPIEEEADSTEPAVQTEALDATEDMKKDDKSPSVQDTPEDSAAEKTLAELDGQSDTAVATEQVMKQRAQASLEASLLSIKDNDKDREESNGQNSQASPLDADTVLAPEVDSVEPPTQTDALDEKVMKERAKSSLEASLLSTKDDGKAQHGKEDQNSQAPRPAALGDAIDASESREALEKAEMRPLSPQLLSRLHEPFPEKRPKQAEAQAGAEATNSAIATEPTLQADIATESKEEREAQGEDKVDIVVQAPLVEPAEPTDRLAATASADDYNDDFEASASADAANLKAGSGTSAVETDGQADAEGKAKVAIAGGERIRVDAELEQIDEDSGESVTKKTGDLGRVLDVDAEIGAVIQWDSGDKGFVGNDDLEKLTIVGKEAKMLGSSDGEVSTTLVQKPAPSEPITDGADTTKEQSVASDQKD
jgi:hypothetical protein